jgi:glycolate oxidase
MAIDHNTASPEWVKDLANILDPRLISTQKEVCEAFGTDRWHAMARPDVVVQAESTGDVQKTLRFANQRRIPVTTRGAGVGYVGGCVPVQGGILLSVAKMNKILEINPHDGVVVIEPGVILNDLVTAVGEQGWYYPPDPASLLECSVGGTIATNAGGPRCLKYGVTRHYVLGLEVVLPDGEILITGGRCHKNKTGLDLIGMFVGSEGLLGVVVKAILRIIPLPEARMMLSATYPTFADAARAVEAILNSRWQPSALEISDAFTLQAARDYLGANTLPEGNAHLIVELDGRKNSLENELDDLRKFLITTGAIHIEEARSDSACEAVWKLRREFSYSLRATGLTKLNEDIVVPRSKLVDLVDFAQNLQEKTGIAIACFGHAGDGNIHTNLMVKDYATNTTNRAAADAALDVLFRWIITQDGQITGEHGVGIAKKRWFKDAVSPVSFNVHRRLKATFDPNNILNPGKFIEL